MDTPDKDRSIRRATILLGVLVVLGGVLLWLLLRSDARQPAGSRIVAKRDLHAFTLLTANDLEMHPSAEPSALTIAELTNRYLLVGLKEGSEVTPSIVAPVNSTQWLGEATAVTISMSATTSLGGQLRPGDMVDLVTVPKGATQVKTFENLMVLNIPPPGKDATVITLAIPHTRRDEFALAVTGAELVLTRRILANVQSK